MLAIRENTEGQPAEQAGEVAAGEGLFASTYAARGRDSTQTVPIADRIAPVLLSARMEAGRVADTLRLRFSEPVDRSRATASPGDLFRYRSAEGAPDFRATPAAISWDDDGKGVALAFPAGQAGATQA